MSHLDDCPCGMCARERAIDRCATLAERRRVVALVRAEAERRRADLVGVNDDTHEFTYESAARDALLALVAKVEGET